MTTSDLQHLYGAMKRLRAVGAPPEECGAIQEAYDELKALQTPAQVVLCPWCNPNVVADRYFLCEKHEAQRKAIK